mgnify:CR=1 FL=1
MLEVAANILYIAGLSAKFRGKHVGQCYDVSRQLVQWGEAWFYYYMPSPSPMRAVARRRGQDFAYYNKLSPPHAVDGHATVDSIL